MMEVVWGLGKSSSGRNMVKHLTVREAKATGSVEKLSLRDSQD